METSISLQRNVDSFKNYLLNIWGNEKPLCKLFSTDKNNYLYDTGTNKIVKCENPEFELLNDLMIMDINDAVDKFSSNHSEKDINRVTSSITKSMENMNVLKITKIENFNLSHNYDFVIDKINNKLGMIQLELTQNCNLRCKYCIYSDFFKEKRNYANVDMKEATAKKAIDYLKLHSINSKKASISFYGGEPLLKFSLLQKSVAYARKIFQKKKINFAMTTNGTLIDKEIAEYLHEQGFSILVSLDGPKDIHDSWRKDINNKGSFERTYRGFKILINEYKKDPYQLALSMVYTPPYSKEKIERISEFITSSPWIPDNIRINITYPQEGSIPYNLDEKQKKTNKTDIDFTLSDWARGRFLSDYKKGIKSHPIATAVLEDKLARLFQRPLIDKPIRSAHLNGCCIPGARKIYITARGSMNVCERIGNAPDIGNVNDGINYKVINKYYLDEYKEKSIKYCSNCWLVRLCPICYQQAFYNNKINLDKKNWACFLQKKGVETSLLYLCSLLEIDNNGLDYLYKFEFS